MKIKNKKLNKYNEGRKILSSSRGFTLIEAIIYLALFGILMSGAVVAAYGILESSSRSAAHVIMQVEGDFLLGKISHALENDSSIAIQQAGTNMTMTEAGITEILSNSNVKVSGLLLADQDIGGVKSTAYSFTLSTLTEDGKPLSQQFKSVKYFR